MPAIFERRWYWRGRAIWRWVRPVLGAPIRAVGGIWRAVGGLPSFLRQFGLESLAVLALTVLVVGAIELMVELVRLGRLPWISGEALREPGVPYRDLRTLLPTVSGIVLGLYFTALATVIQSRYEQVPAPVASLLTRDRVGSQYVTLLAVAIGVSVAEMITEGLGRVPSLIHLAGLGLVALLALFSFANLGRRAFSFLDPTRLMDTVMDEVLWAIQQVMAGARGWSEGHSQESARARADDALDVASMLVELTRQAPNIRAQRSALRVHAKLARMVQVYMRAKTTIPTRSKWFGAVAQHRAWYRAGFSELDLALATQTSLQPELVPDAEWIERRAFEMLLGTAEHHSTTGGLADLAPVLELLGSSLYSIGAAWQISTGLEWARRIESSAAVAKDREGNATAPATIDAVARCTDLAALARIQLVLGFGAVARSIDVSRLPELIAQANWERTETPERLGLPWDPRQTAEDAQRSIAFEHRSEAGRVTPAWYVTELVALRLAKGLEANFALLAGAATRPLHAPAQETALQTLAAALEASRRLEESAKIAALLPVIDRVQLDLGQLNRSQDQKWAEWQHDKMQKLIETSSQNAHVALAGLIFPLSKIPSTPNLPDFLGEAVTKTGEATLISVIKGTDGGFPKLFAPYFFGCLAVTGELLKTPASFDVAADMVRQTEPLRDALEISGYALLYAGITQERASWSAVEALWRKWFTDAPQRLGFVAALLALGVGLYGFTPRSLRRTTWSQIVRADLDQRRREGLNLRRSTSPLVRTFAGSSFGLVDGTDLMKAGFLRKLPGAEALDFGPDRMSDALKREEERGAQPTEESADDDSWGGPLVGDNGIEDEDDA